ncbi:hypothetical protein J6590_082743 [Homalodisca vitripennis]|nr:hypothetical protein J6590_082743 [Homalodisca vitripennis]
MFLELVKLTNNMVVVIPDLGVPQRFGEVRAKKPSLTLNLGKHTHTPTHSPTYHSPRDQRPRNHSPRDHSHRYHSPRDHSPNGGNSGAPVRSSGEAVSAHFIN